MKKLKKAFHKYISESRILYLLVVFFIQAPVTLFAQEYVNQLIDSLTIVSNHKDKARISQDIVLELKNTDWDRTLKYLIYSEKEALESDSDEILARYYIVAANIYNEKDVLDIALDYYQKAYRIIKKGNNYKEKFKLENDLAIIYGRLNNRDKALFYFKKVYQNLIADKDSIYLAQVYNNIGTLYLEKNNDSSKYYYLKGFSN